MGVHLFAIQVSDENSPEVRVQEKEFIYNLMRDFVGSHPINDPDLVLECWWDADEDRIDRSDNDSAVFVTKGQAGAASRLLMINDLTGPWNVPSPAQGEG